MKYYTIRLIAILLAGLLISFECLKAEASELPIERQLEIIDNYAVATGIRTAFSSTLAGDNVLPVRPPRCGTPAILEFYQNYNRIDPRLLASAGIKVDRLRPQMTFQFDSPGGRVRIHYEKTGPGAVWQAGVDSDGDNVPDYIETVADIGDNVYNHLRDSLGYVDSLGNLLIIVDTLCESGGDDRIDIYLSNLSTGLYGRTWPQDSCQSAIGISRPAWVEIDHDFQTLPAYVNRPLDAAKVTIAHEMFHVLHFAMDATEAAPWFEMTATWLEEEIYDEVNDYYLGIDFFFKVPGRSIQSVQGFHQYASSVWPIFLSEKYGPGIIRDTWFHAAKTPGHQYLEGFDLSIKSATGSADNFASAFNEFWVWNYFTGQYSSTAPDNIGYQEKAAYSVIPLDSMDVQKFFPITVISNFNKFKPEHNAAAYIRLEELQALVTDYWKCTAFQNPFDPNSPCVDSVFVVDDTMLSVFLGADSIDLGGWSLSVIYQLEDLPDSHFVESYPDIALQPSQLLESFTDTIDYRPYRSITLVLSNTTIDESLYQHGQQVGVRYTVSDHSGFISELANLPPAILTPYPNPAIVSELDGDGMKFRMQVPTDSTSFPSLPSAKIQIDIYNVAGEYLVQLQGGFTGEDRLGANRAGIYEVAWDMKNQSGKDVASGVYIAYARLYDGIKAGELLAQGEVKVAVIR